MEFRPCIDIHNGKVKQIVGGTLKDQNDQAAENFVSEQDAPFYAQLYKRYGISGGHIILLNARDSSYYEATKLQALAALQVYPGGLQCLLCIQRCADIGSTQHCHEGNQYNSHHCFDRTFHFSFPFNRTLIYCNPTYLCYFSNISPLIVFLCLISNLINTSLRCPKRLWI